VGGLWAGVGGLAGGLVGFGGREGGVRHLLAAKTPVGTYREVVFPPKVCCRASGEGFGDHLSWSQNQTGPPTEWARSSRESTKSAPVS
jgi:hypothetical protein